MLKCQILDDNPETCDDLEKFLKRNGLKTDITKNAKIWARRSGLIKAKEGYSTPINPLIIDNHLESAISLNSVGISQKQRRLDAGLNILEGYLLPLIAKVIIPFVPIAIVSSADISDLRADFSSQYSNQYDNVCFFSKDEEKGEGQQEAYRYLNLCKSYYKDYGANSGADTQLAINILNDIASDYQLSDDDLRKIFNFAPEIQGKVLDVLLGSPTFDWKEKVVLLSKVDSLLTSVFATRASPVDAANNWLRSERMSDGRTALDTLREGRLVGAQEVVERASFFPIA